MKKYVVCLVAMCGVLFLQASFAYAEPDPTPTPGPTPSSSPSPDAGGGGNALEMLLQENASASLTNQTLDFTINDGSGVTNNNNLTITFNANPSTVTGYIISLDGTLPYLNQTGIMPYAATAPFVLPNVYGTYTVYVRYYSVTGQYSQVISHQIIYGKNGVSQKGGLFHFTRYLKQGMSGYDVKELQIFLNDQGYKVATTGPGSAGNETEFFGPETEMAVVKWQEAHADAILTPQGLTQGTGLFYNYSIDFANKTIDKQGKI